MKMIRRILSVILLAGILCGCGAQTKSESFPFLDEKARTKIEESILKGLVFRQDEYKTTAYFRNDSDYTLLDVRLITENSDVILCSTPYLEKDTACRLNVYTQSFQDAENGDKIGLVYTIGDYTYYSRLKVSARTEEAEKTLPAIPDSVSTRDGLTELDYSKAMKFSSGTEILGLKQFRIYSILAEVPYERTVLLHINGKDADDYRYSLIAKLLNEDGIVVSSNMVYLSSENQSELYFFDIEPGSYTLVFEEAE